MHGIGGIFFDHMSSADIEKDFNKTVSLSNSFIDSYFPIVEKRLNEKFNDDDVDVEFNLIHDRGTLFGLKTKGRVDSILISLHKRCLFTYQYKPKAGSPHEKMLEYYKPFEW